MLFDKSCFDFADGKFKKKQQMTARKSDQKSIDYGKSRFFVQLKA